MPANKCQYFDADGECSTIQRHRACCFSCTRTCSVVISAEQERVLLLFQLYKNVFRCCLSHSRTYSVVVSAVQERVPLLSQPFKNVFCCCFSCTRTCYVVVSAVQERVLLFQLYKNVFCCYFSRTRTCSVVVSAVQERVVLLFQLYKNVFCTDVGQSLAFIGFVQPASGGVLTMSETQARWWAELCKGNLRLPGNDEMEADIVADLVRPLPSPHPHPFKHVEGALRFRMVLRRTMHKLRRFYWLLNRITAAMTNENEVIVYCPP